MPKGPIYILGGLAQWSSPFSHTFVGFCLLCSMSLWLLIVSRNSTFNSLNWNKCFHWQSCSFLGSHQNIMFQKGLFLLTHGLCRSNPAHLPLMSRPIKDSVYHVHAYEFVQLNTWDAGNRSCQSPKMQKVPVPEINIQ